MLQTKPTVSANGKMRACGDAGVQFSRVRVRDKVRVSVRDRVRVGVSISDGVRISTIYFLSY